LRRFIDIRYTHFIHTETLILQEINFTNCYKPKRPRQRWKVVLIGGVKGSGRWRTAAALVGERLRSMAMGSSRYLR
jgi:hypothetical protein